MKIDFSRYVPIAAFLMAFFLPIHTGISNLFLILIFVSAFFSYVFQKKYQFRNPKILLYTLIPIFSLHLIGLFYSDPLFYGTKIIGQTISFLLCPLILLWLPKPIIGKIVRSLKRGIVYGVTVSLLILFTIVFVKYFATRPFPKIDNELFGYSYTYHQFSGPLIEFAAYLGSYTLLAFAIVMHEVFQKSRQNKTFGILQLLLFSIGMVFINARIILVLFAFLLVVASSWGLRVLIKQKQFIALGFSLIIGAIILFLAGQLLAGSFVQTRMTDELRWELSNQVSSGYNDRFQADSRIPRWQAAIEVIEQNPIIGHGTYSEKKELALQYEKNALWASLKNRYDAHNMYLSFAIEYGIVGVLFYLFFLISNLVIALKNRDAVYSFFVLMVIAISIFESYLLNNAGITFVALFMTGFLYHQIFKTKAEKPI